MRNVCELSVYAYYFLSTHFEEVFVTAGCSSCDSAFHVLQDVTKKRIDARLREVPISMSYSNVFPNTKPAIREGPESHSIVRGSDDLRTVKLSVKKVTGEQDTDWISVAPTFPVSDSFKESSNIKPAKDGIVQQNRNRVQAPSSGTSILPSDSNSQDDPLCPVKEIRVDSGGETTRKEGHFYDRSTEFPNQGDEIDNENCTTSRRRQKKVHWRL